MATIHLVGASLIALAVSAPAIAQNTAAPAPAVAE